MMESSVMNLPKSIKIIKKLGNGTFSNVYLIKDERYHADYHDNSGYLALKIIKNGSSVANIDREVQIHRNIDHQNICKFIHYEQILGEKLLYFEYVDNGSLRDHLKINSLGLGIKKSLKYFEGLINGIDYLHNNCNVVHRDLKPSNIMIDSNDQIKIIDFGSATIYKFFNEEFQLIKVVGHDSYRAPETFIPHDHINVPSHKAQPLDIWSAGIILVEMLTGRLPWTSVYTTEFKIYEAFSNGDVLDLNHMTIFNDIDSTIFVILIEPVLQVDPKVRLSMMKIKDKLKLVKNFYDL